MVRKIDYPKQFYSRQRIGEVAAPGLNEFTHPQVQRKAAFLKDDPDSLAELSGARRRCEAENLDDTSGCAPVALEYLDGGCLACSVRTQERVHAASGNFEGDPLEDLMVTVGLAKVADDDR